VNRTSLTNPSTNRGRPSPHLNTLGDRHALGHGIAPFGDGISYHEPLLQSGLCGGSRHVATRAVAHGGAGASGGSSCSGKHARCTAALRVGCDTWRCEVCEMLLLQF
jgi:hypothetical protein